MSAFTKLIRPIGPALTIFTALLVSGAGYDERHDGDGRVERCRCAHGHGRARSRGNRSVRERGGRVHRALEAAAAARSEIGR